MSYVTFRNCAVALAAGTTVLLATRLGLPVSTTHALIGGLVGAAMTMSAGAVNVNQLASGFMLPLLVSPLLAVLGTVALYPMLSRLRRRIGVTQETCVCLGDRVVAVVPGALHGERAMQAVSLAAVSTGTTPVCRVRSMDA